MTKRAIARASTASEREPIIMAVKPPGEKLKISSLLRQIPQEALAKRRAARAERGRAANEQADLELLRQIRDVTQKLNALEQQVMSRSAAVRDTLTPRPPPQNPSDHDLRSVPLWSERENNNSLNPVAFIRSHYAPWIGKGLTRAHIRRRDMPLYRAFAVWVHRHPEDDIEELPRRSSTVDQTLDRLARDIDPEDIRKLGLALQSRRRRRM
jgi:hypothetical protein